MRYTLFEKARKRHKETVSQKDSNTVPSKSVATPSYPIRGEKKNSEVEMRLESNGARRARDVSVEETNRRLLKHQKESRDQTGPKDLVETIKINSKSHRKGFLPIAMPKPDPPQHLDDQYEARAEFGTPDQIDLQSSELDVRTEVSDITQLTYGPPGRIAPGQVAIPYTRNTKRQQMRRLVEQREGSENHKSYRSLAHLSPTEETGTTNVVAQSIDPQPENAGRGRPDRDLIVEKRHGLPYESTDFRGEDEESVDSWGKAIVGSHIIEAMDTPVKVEAGTKVFTLGAPSPRAKIVDLVKETRSLDGEVVIDLSEIQDEDISDVETLRKSLRNTELVTTFPQIDPGVALLPGTPSITSPRSDDRKSTPTSLQKGDRSILPKAVQTQSKEAPVEQRNPRESSSDDVSFGAFLSSSFSYMKTIASDIGSRIENIELLPETEMDNLLGVLNKDLVETSSNVPEKKEVVRFIGERFQDTACEIDRTVRENAPDIELSANSIDELVDNVKESYQNNLANCGIRSSAQNASEPFGAQTFMVPMSMQANGNETEVPNQTKAELESC